MNEQFTKTQESDIIDSTRTTSLMHVQAYRSRWWFLLPIFMQWIGGIIAYFALRHDDPPKAKNCLYLGIVLTALTVLSLSTPIILLTVFDTGVPAIVDSIPASELIFLNLNLE